MAKQTEPIKIKTIQIDELSTLLEEAVSVDSEENAKGFVTHSLETSSGKYTVLPSPSDELFFLISLN